jgi:hypothetical protein
MVPKEPDQERQESQYIRAEPSTVANIILPIRKIIIVPKPVKY